MKLSQIVSEYRAAHHISQRQFAIKCGLSNALISMIEGSKNPSTGRQLTPSLKTLHAIACGMEMTLHQLLILADDIRVDLTDAYTGAPGDVPLIYGVAAGSPIFAEDNIIDYIPVSVRNADECFALVVRGESMVNANIPDGAKIVVHMQHTAEDGQIVVCRVNRTEATLKRFKRLASHVLLMPENPAFEPIIVPAEDFDNGDAEILGVVVQIIIDV